MVLLVTVSVPILHIVAPSSDTADLVQIIAVAHQSHPVAQLERLLQLPITRFCVGEALSAMGSVPILRCVAPSSDTVEVVQRIVVLVSQPVAQPVAQPVVQPVAQPVAQPVVQPVDHLVDQPVDQSVDLRESLLRALTS
jgi:hypothetical protein